MSNNSDNKDNTIADDKRTVKIEQIVCRMIPIVKTIQWMA